MKKLFAAIIILLILSLFFVLSGCNPKPQQGLKPPESSPSTGSGIDTRTAPKGPATYVPKDKTPESFIKEHYKYVLKGNFDKAYDMLPAETKAQQPKDQYIEMQKSLKITSYKITDVNDQGDIKNINVTFKMTGVQDSWTTVWTFNKSKKGWEVSSKKSVQQ